MLGQAVGAGVGLSAVALLGRPWLALAVAAAGLVWVLALNAEYGTRLGRKARTVRRARGDSAVARQILVAYLIPAAVAVVVMIDTGVSGTVGAGPFTPEEVSALVLIVSTTVAVWLMSSHVDWYFVRPRIDGVVCEPPCQTSGDSRWKGVTRKWYLHRAVASLATMAAVVAIAVVVTLMMGREYPSQLNQIGGFAAVVAVGLWLMKAEIQSAGPTVQSIRSPRHWLGDDLRYETDKWKRRGYVLHVAIPVTKLVPLRWKSGKRVPGTTFSEEKSSVLADAHCERLEFHGCDDRCSRINPECTVDEPREVPRKSRGVVV